MLTNTTFSTTFDWTIAPLSPEAFFREYWEQKHLLIQRNDPTYFAGLLSSSDVDCILTERELRTPAFRLVRDGQVLPTTSYTTDALTVNSDPIFGLADINQVYAEYQDGATITIQALHRNWGPIAAYCQVLQQVFGCPIQANAYLTPPNAQGFENHYDMHDVLVIQTEGRKRWRLYDAPFPLPLSGQSHSKTGAIAGECSLDIILEAGDSLYIPRGLFHEALTVEDSHSLHITIGVQTNSWASLLQQAFDEVMEQCSQDIMCRRGIPTHALDSIGDTGAVAFAHAREIASTLLDSERIPARLERLQKRFIKSRYPALRGQFADLNRLAITELDETTPLQRRMLILYELEEHEESISLSFHGKTVEFPAYTRPLIEAILERDYFTIQDLPQVLDTEGTTVLVRRLLREGLLSFAHEAV